jgi:hypothetical protein
VLVFLIRTFGLSRSRIAASRDWLAGEITSIYCSVLFLSLSLSLSLSLYSLHPSLSPFSFSFLSRCLAFPIVISLSFLSLCTTPSHFSVSTVSISLALSRFTSFRFSASLSVFLCLFSLCPSLSRFSSACSYFSSNKSICHLTV